MKQLRFHSTLRMLGNKCIEVLIHALVFWNVIVSGQFYDQKTLKEWGKISEVCKSGKNQSPIDISRRKVIDVYEPDHYLELINYNEECTNVITENNGEYSAKITGTWEGKKPAVSGPALSNEIYAFDSVHIHWGRRNNGGTEHSIQHKKYAAELHAVHVNIKYANMSEALNYPDGLAVIGALYQVDDTIPTNIGMKRFASMSENSAEVCHVLDVSSFLPKSISSFYRYNGSLTTPPCTENVSWIVLEKLQPIDSSTMKLLRKSQSTIIDSKPVRPLQRLHGRRIELYHHNY